MFGCQMPRWSLRDVEVNRTGPTKNISAHSMILRGNSAALVSYAQVEPSVLLGWDPLSSAKQDIASLNSEGFGLAILPRVQSVIQVGSVKPLGNSHRGSVQVMPNERRKRSELIGPATIFPPA